ncbi:GOLPH3/VPS74 family protein [Microbacterium sp. Yaish 1]|uniref:GOLPH3/VPS74 family protein n=1 Tax=Microbacterium sp. Yaish 1 TaxID=2025014 RepID=UPI0015C5D224|nr:GPP34 family phosphoprotein [Microbacterium sp. Yaish 1]
MTILDYWHVRLADSLFVLAHRPDGKRVVQRKFLTIGLGGAVLTDLVVHRRVSLADAKVVPDDAGVVLPGLPGEFDAIVRSEARPRSAEHWVRKFRSSDVEGRVAGHAVRSGLATAEEDAVLGFIPVARYAPNQAALDDLAARVSDVLADRRTATDWDASLVGLCDATGVLKKVFPGTPKSAVKSITEGEWASEALRKVITQANAAVRNAVISTVHANNGSQGF